MDARAARETIPLVCLGHIKKIMEAINDLLGMSVSTAHPLSLLVHLHCTIWYFT
jgi:transcriptional regulatory protein LevR